MAVFVLDRRKKPLMPCSEKRAQPVESFLAHDPKRLARIRAQAKAPLRDAAAVNSTRWALFQALQASGSFNIQTAAGVVQGIGHRHCRILQRGDGYGYWHQPFVAQLDKGSGNRERASRAALSLPGINAGVSREK